MFKPTEKAKQIVLDIANAQNALNVYDRFSNARVCDNYGV